MPKRRKKSTGRKSAPRSRSRARKGAASRSKRGGSKRSSRGGRSKRPTIGKVMRRVKTSGRSGVRRSKGMIKKATDFALNAAESALDSIL